MSDWAHNATDKIQRDVLERYGYLLMGGEIIVAALVKARNDALEEAERAVTEKFKAESELCAADLTAAIRALKEKTP
jgi:hypothetical protein